MNYEDVKSRIKKHEGFIAKVYLDSLGKATIGYGHLLTEDDDFEEGIIYDKDILEELFDKDFNKAKQGMEELVGTLDIAMAAKGIIIEMVFQLGKTGVSKFKNMFAALNEYDYTRAAEEMLNSAWYRQTPSRCEELSNLMRKCQA
jgi:GH24 family phage-related lysozyme (muramidase)